jgi:hypothetical protein
MAKKAGKVQGIYDYQTNSRHVRKIEGRRREKGSEIWFGADK